MNVTEESQKRHKEENHGRTIRHRTYTDVATPPAGTSVKTTKRPKVLKKSAKSDWVSLGRESHKSLLHSASAVSHWGKQSKIGFAPCQKLLADTHAGHLSHSPYALLGGGCFGCSDMCQAV